jgi:hypothetical protein
LEPDALERECDYLFSYPQGLDSTTAEDSMTDDHNPRSEMPDVTHRFPDDLEPRLAEYDWTPPPTRPQPPRTALTVERKVIRHWITRR